MTNGNKINKTKVDIINDVIRIEKMGNKTFLVFPQGEVSESLLNIDELDDTLSKKCFIRTHTNHLVNKRHLKSHFDSYTQWITLDNGEKVPLSPNYQQFKHKKSIKQFWQKFFRQKKSI